MKLVGANLVLVLMAVFTIFASAADNEVFITQSGTNAQIASDQIGSGTTVEGNAAAGSEPLSDFKLTGNSQTIDIDQIGDSNIFRGDIDSDTFTGNFSFTGDSNEFDIQFDPASSYISDNITMDVTITGSSNDLTVTIANNNTAANRR
jgi:hypothetical protein